MVISTTDSKCVFNSQYKKLLATEHPQIVMWFYYSVIIYVRKVNIEAGQINTNKLNIDINPLTIDIIAGKVKCNVGQVNISLYTGQRLAWVPLHGVYNAAKINNEISYLVFTIHTIQQLGHLNHVFVFSTFRENLYPFEFSSTAIAHNTFVNFYLTQ